MDNSSFCQNHHGGILESLISNMLQASVPSHTRPGWYAQSPSGSSALFPNNPMIASADFFSKHAPRLVKQGSQARRFLPANDFRMGSSTSCPGADSQDILRLRRLRARTLSPGPILNEIMIPGLHPAEPTPVCAVQTPGRARAAPGLQSSP